MGAGIGQQYIPAGHIDPLFGQFACQMVSQRAEAKRLTIGGEIAVLIACHRPHGATNAFQGQPFIG
ncbi:hypothetical protein D9M70_635300 [compost metagenome]